VKNRFHAVDRNEQRDEDGLTMIIAGVLCLVTMPVIYFATRPLLQVLHPPWMHWLLAALFTLMPLYMAFIVLYCSSWHERWPKSKRIPWLVLSSLIIFVADLVAMALIVAIGSYFPGFAKGE
jgi:hypothetical protein